MKDILPDLISSNQTAYVKNRYISGSGRLIYDVLETANILNKKGFLVTADIEKSFDSVDHSFLLAVLQKYGFGERLIKSNNDIKGLDIYGHNFLYTAYADDSSFFFKNKKSVIEVFKILDEFSFFSGLKPNKEV